MSLLRLPLILCVVLTARAAPPPGFEPLFNEHDLAGWRGADTVDPRRWLAMSAEDQARTREASLADIRAHWHVEQGELVNDGAGLFLTSERLFGDYELRLEYRTVPRADSGVYLKGVPQVQIWDAGEADPQNLGRAKGSGGLWNNAAGAPGKDPLVFADRPHGDWNRLRVVQVGARTSVWLNERLVVDHALLENYFDRPRAAPAGQLPIPPRGPIQLQTHGGEIRWRDVHVREIPGAEANAILAARGGENFRAVFNGRDFAGWDGPVDAYEIVDAAVRCRPNRGGTIFTREEFGDFVLRVEFKVPPGGNNGLAIRYPGTGDGAYVGMCELQVLDDHYERVKGPIDPRQAHGSVYGIVAAARGYHRPAGEWNFQEVTVRGTKIRVELNGTVILDTDVAHAPPALEDKPHPGLLRARGHLGLCGHNDPVEFRHLAVKPLE